MGYLELLERIRDLVLSPKTLENFPPEHNRKVIFSPVGDHRATGLVKRLIRALKERLLVMAQEHPKPSLESALLKIIK